MLLVHSDSPLSLFSAIDLLILSSLPRQPLCVCTSPPEPTEQRIWLFRQETDQELEEGFRLSDHIPPNLTIRSIDDRSRSAGPVVPKLLSHFAAGPPSLPPLSCSLTCNLSESPIMCRGLIEAYGPRLGHCELRLHRHISTWPAIKAPMFRLSFSNGRPVEFSACTSLTSLTLSGQWDVYEEGSYVNSDVCFAFTDILSTVHPSVVQRLAIFLFMQWGTDGSSIRRLRNGIYPTCDWRGLQLVLRERFSAVRVFRLNLRLRCLRHEYQVAVAKWLRESIEKELGDWVKNGVLRVDITIR